MWLFQFLYVLTATYKYKFCNIDPSLLHIVVSPQVALFDCFTVLKAASARARAQVGYCLLLLL